MHTKIYTPDADYVHIINGATYYAAWRISLRRAIAYLAIRLDPAWLDASPDVLEAWLPRNWHYLAHHELVTYLDVQGITPELCTMS